MLLPRKEYWRRWRVEWLSTSIQCVITWGNMQNPQQSMQGPCIFIYFFVVCSRTTQKWHAACNDHLLHQNSVCQSLPNYLGNFSTTYRFMLKFNTPHDAFHTASLRTMLSEAVWGQTHTEKVSFIIFFLVLIPFLFSTAVLLWFLIKTPSTYLSWYALCWEYALIFYKIWIPVSMCFKYQSNAFI